LKLAVQRRREKPDFRMSDRTRRELRKREIFELATLEFLEAMENVLPIGRKRTTNY